MWRELALGVVLELFYELMRPQIIGLTRREVLDGCQVGITFTIRGRSIALMVVAPGNTVAAPDLLPPARILKGV